MKPSYGLISTRGVVPLSYRLDHVGPLTRTVSDAALMLNALAGFDPECPESRRGPSIDGALPEAGRLDGLKIGILANFDAETQEPGIAAAFRRSSVGVSPPWRGRASGSGCRATTSSRRRRAGFVRVEVEAAFTHGALRQSEPERFSPQMRDYIDYGAKVAATQLMRSDRLHRHCGVRAQPVSRRGRRDHLADHAAGRSRLRHAERQCRRLLYRGELRGRAGDQRSDGSRHKECRLGCRSSAHRIRMRACSRIAAAFEAEAGVAAVAAATHRPGEGSRLDATS